MKYSLLLKQEKRRNDKMSVESTSTLVGLLALFLGYIIGRIAEKGKWIEKYISVDDIKDYFARRKDKEETPIAD
jgi:hypothetical protein